MSTMVTTGMLAKRVQRGATLLDKKMGEKWREQVNSASLSMFSPCTCVLGQLFYTSYNGGLRALGIETWKEEIAYGFELAEHDMDDWYTLTNLWREEIRRAV
jgi:hypothetical protein